MIKKVLFVGFEHTAPDYVSLRNHLETLCDKYGCKAVFPIDNQRSDDQLGRFNTLLDEARAIFRVNLHRIDFADVVIANLDYFDGNGFCTNDAAFEIGYAVSKNKRILGFVDAEHLLGAAKYDRKCCTLHTSDEKRISPHPVSRMVASAVSVIIRGGIEDCLTVIFDRPHGEISQEKSV